jgi:hypothetical protein
MNTKAVNHQTNSDFVGVANRGSRLSDGSGDISGDCSACRPKLNGVASRADYTALERFACTSWAVSSLYLPKTAFATLANLQSEVRRFDLVRSLSSQEKLFLHRNLSSRRLNEPYAIGY